jgi:CubicO group peptidase (beta-lactamase class C family)
MLAQYVDRLRRERLFFAPGTIVAHNSSRYYAGASADLLAARLLEYASGERWSRYVQAHISERAGMSSTSFTRSVHDAVGYGRDRSGRVVARPLPAPTVDPPVDRGLWSTVLDIGRLDRGLRSGLLSSSSLALQDAPVLARDRLRGIGSGCCWIVTRHFGHRAEYTGAHGSGDGFYATFERYADDGLVVLLFTNLGGSAPAFAVADLAASIALGEYPSGVALNATALRDLTGTYESRQRLGRHVFSARVTLAIAHSKLDITNATAFPNLAGPLVAASDSIFAAQYAPAVRLDFKRDATGKGRSFVLSDINSGWRIRFHRVAK